MHLGRLGVGEGLCGAEQPVPLRPFRVDLPPTATVTRPGQVPPVLGDRPVRQRDQVEPVDDHDRVRQGEPRGAGVGRGGVHRHVGDPGPPGRVLLLEPADHRIRGSAVDLREQAAGAAQIDQAGIEPVHPHL